MSAQESHEPECRTGTGPVAQVIAPVSKDLGAFSVRRVLPSPECQRVGPFVFFDHMGPAQLPAGKGMDVRPHPHIGIATVTFLFEGEVMHRDSLGVEQPIRPGAVNWMTAGRGIVHSERSPAELMDVVSPLHGIQTWLALPLELEETDPGFVHYPAEDIPLIETAGASISLIAGRAFGAESPVATASDTFYSAVDLDAGATLDIPADVEERGVYLVSGSARVAGSLLAEGSMAVLHPGARAVLSAEAPSRLMLIGGGPLDGDRLLWWNFVSSRAERIEQAKDDWRNDRFDAVPGETEWIPLPD